MQVNNPHLDKKRTLIVEVERLKSELGKNNIDIDYKKELIHTLHNKEIELEAIEGDCRIWTQEKLDELSESIEKVEYVMENLKKEYPKKTHQLDKLVELKRKVQGRFKDGELIQEGLIHKLRKLSRAIRKE